MAVNEKKKKLSHTDCRVKYMFKSRNPKLVPINSKYSVLGLLCICKRVVTKTVRHSQGQEIILGGRIGFDSDITRSNWGE